MIRHLFPILIFLASLGFAETTWKQDLPKGFAEYLIEGTLPEIQGEEYKEADATRVVGIFQLHPMRGTLSFISTGVIICPEKVLTSAHAIQNLAAEEIAILEGNSGTVILANSIGIDARYEPGSHRFDLGMICLDHPIPDRRLNFPKINFPTVLSLSSVPKEGLKVIQLEVTAENGYYTSSSKESFLGPGNSGSPLYTPDDNGDPVLKGIFSRQEFSLDRSAQTRYYFAEVEQGIADSTFIPNSDSTVLSHNALIPLPDTGLSTFPYSMENCFDTAKNLYGLSFINRSDGRLSISFPDLKEQGISTIAYPLGNPDEKTFSNDFTSKIFIGPNVCLAIVFRPNQDEGKITLKIEKPPHFAKPPPK